MKSLITKSKAAFASLPKLPGCDHIAPKYNGPSYDELV